ncbi:hypothetical protein HER10_EVM0009719 [Colletotrichum scovillei]|uniref:Uncharacterized protein n=2 Tax=Colletotrichum acutatum species complex TaxID=2707335 RepID=A0A9P7QSG6_9PEZI|nr:uncharacterized protein HER10_EVM0009719 [Colletotrichum scovillei]KAF4775367.1 hypothetical protein HER10_EVM0009719 [Colletotrichum scovillei]KAG7038319.1 hypothetical protein JMJ78_0012928 [Colletotrichum scovillei]KAG7040642.1 hypothetical protein JMJ77_0013639 [Colletotrichum scovillei]KAG7060689.1 hypothetical protein JMJ76_0006232 [Colletotrichum scovillei]
MASYFPEGECFFVRSSLKYGNTWSAENEEQFYSHVLIEYQWNGWIGSGSASSMPTHLRSKSQSGTASLYNTRFWQWDRFFVGESKTTDPSSLTAITSYPNSLNWNEMRDRDKGGPRKYILRPVKIRRKDTEWLWIDATIPIRAIYFPVCQQTDEAYKQYCTYVVIDFKARDTINCFNIAGEPRTYPSTREAGLGLNKDLTWLFKVPDLITYLTIPHKLRNPEYGVYNATTRTDALFLVGHAGRTWTASDTVHTDGFIREIDLANVISATFGVEVGWRPYKYSSFILDLVTHVVQLGLGFIPGAGPLLSVAFGIGLQLLNDPETFKADNVLDISAAVLSTLIASAGKSKKYVAPGFLPGATMSTRMASMRMAPMALTSASEADDMVANDTVADEVDVFDEGGAAEKKKAGEEENARITASIQAQRQVLELKLDEAFRRAGY